MNKRDKAILDNLKKFRVLNRDQLIGLHFNNLNQKTVTCNRVMKRLRERGLVECDTSRVPYNYFLNPPSIRKDSMKLFHFQAIADFYLEASKYGAISEFEVEFKTGEKGSIEPDIYMVWNNAPFFVEIQRSVYTKKVMEAKIERYEKFYEQEEWKSFTKYFPYILIITDHKYTLQPSSLRIFQAPSIQKFVESQSKKKAPQ